MNNPENMALLRHTLHLLQPVLDEVVLVGGMATGLLVTDAAAERVRYTKDIDLLIGVSTRGGYYQFSEKLRTLGFSEDTTEDAPMCRWKREDILLDVMTPDADVLGFTNLWYEPSFHHTLKFTLDGLDVRVVDAPHFLATKLEAFKSRGNGDLLGSHDMDDILSVIDGRPELTTEIHQASPELRAYLKAELGQVMQDPDFLMWLEGFTPMHAASRRDILQARIRQLVE